MNGLNDAYFQVIFLSCINQSDDVLLKLDLSSQSHCDNILKLILNRTAFKIVRLYNNFHDLKIISDTFISN